MNDRHDRGAKPALVRLLEAAGAVALVLLMSLVTIDVAGRNLLNSPVPWGTEMLEIIVAAMIFLIYPLLAFESGHITVDLIQVSPAFKVVQRVLASVIGAVVYGIIAGCMGKQALRVMAYGDVSPVLGIPLGWVLGMMCVLAGVTVVAFLAAAAGTLRAGTAGLPAEVALEKI